MKATKAYIASLGTTGVLLGASLLMLAVVSAVVAFDRWPNGQVSTRVQTLVLADQAPGIRIGAPPAGTRAATGAGRVAAALRGASRVNVPTSTVRSVQRVAGQRTAGGRPATPTTLPKLPAPVGTPQLPELPNQLPDQLSTGDAAGVVGVAADQTQTASGQVGGSVGGDGGQAVSGTGQTVADTLRSVPVPGPILPGS